MKQQLTLQELLDAIASEELFEDMTYADFLRLADPGRLQRSGYVRGPPMEIYGNSKQEYHVFNYKSYPSTTGFRHKGYIAFKKPKGKPRPVEQLAVEVDCDCDDYRYRWAWANRQKGAGKIGPQSLNKCINRAPRITNPSGKPALCKHLLAARHSIMGLLAHFPKPTEGETDVDISWKLDQLVKQTQKRSDNYAAAREKARAMTKSKNLVRNYRNVYGPMAQAEVPPAPEDEPVPLPPEMPEEPRMSPRKSPLAPPAPGALGPQLPAAPPVAPKKSEKLGASPAAKPPTPVPRKPQSKKRGESLVVIQNSDTRMNAELLKESKTIVEEMGDELDTELSAPGGAEGNPGEELPPPATTDEMPPMGDEMPPGEGGSPEDEALNLLREIAGGITRLADEIAPIAAEEEAEIEGEAEPLPDEDEGEGDKKDIAVPPVEDEDEFSETMPVPTGA
jgi:hypothetical protein